MIFTHVFEVDTYMSSTPIPNMDLVVDNGQGAMRLSQKADSDAMPEITVSRVYEATPIDKTAIASSSLDTRYNDEAPKRFAGILSYSLLINFKNRYSAGGGSNLPRIKNISQEFCNKMFVDSDKNRIADDKIGSFISYVLVLTLMVDEFQTGYTDIAKDLKMSALSPRPYFENLGCKFARRNKVAVAILPIPFKFPTLRKKRIG
uniref:Uncharacterized protein n=1 Tax=Chenopodium quinoa TaxID=63459 RepID=A0A803KPP1_CHEQI